MRRETARRDTGALRMCMVALAVIWLCAVGPSWTAFAGNHQVKAGETLGTIATQYYGHRHYRWVIIKLNRLKDPNKDSHNDTAGVPAGTSLRVPDLKAMLLTEGLPPSTEAELDKIIDARYGFLRLHEALARALHPNNSKAPVQVPADLGQDLQKIADAWQQAGRSLAKQGNFGDSPTRMRQRLERAAELARRLCQGATEAGLEDQIHLLLAQAWVRGLMWARNEDGDL